MAAAEAPESGPPMTSLPPTAAESRAIAGPRYDIIDERCAHRNCADNKTAYRMSGSCMNCKAGPLVGLFTADHAAFTVQSRCPACGCREVRWKQLADLDPDTAL
jgi:hypothetical protein